MKPGIRLAKPYRSQGQLDDSLRFYCETLRLKDHEAIRRWASREFCDFLRWGLGAKERDCLDGLVDYFEAVVTTGEPEAYVHESYALEGTSLGKVTAYHVGWVSGGSGGVTQKRWLPDGRVLFSMVRLGPYGLGILDLNRNAGDSDAVTPIATPRGAHALALDLDGGFVYLGVLGRVIYRASLDEVLDAAENPDGDRPTWEPVVSLPEGSTQLEVLDKDTLLAATWGKQSSLFAIDTSTGDFRPLCADEFGINGDSEGMTIDPNTGDVIFSTGGAQNFAPRFPDIVTFRIVDGTCELVRTTPRPSAILSGNSTESSVASKLSLASTVMASRGSARRSLTWKSFVPAMDRPRCWT